MRPWAPVALAFLLAGCASTVETVDRRMLLQPGTETYELDPMELFVMPMELEAPLPTWSFSPAMICRFRPDQRDKRARGDCRGDVDVQRVPVRLAYAFEFQRRDGGVAVAPRRLPSD